MRYFLLTVLCAVVLNAVVAAGENEVKRGSFPFMAFLYYTDETIIEDGARFTRSAALISNDWLISSADTFVAFPKKTLLARLGAIDIDQKFTLNEDEGEQEREIILILRPHNYRATEWWKTDISLLKTLLPFNKTSSVAAAHLINNLDPLYNNCYILFYSRRSANVTERTLMQMDVDLLPPMKKECGNYFSKETMACGIDSENNSTDIDSNFCQGNRGGPLVCDSELVGVQTYINDCKQPHLYQLLIVWKKFINCAVEEQHLAQQCADISIAITKDPPPRTSETPKLADAIVDMLLDKIDTQTAFTQSDTEATESSTTTKEVEQEPTPTTTRVVKSKSLETKIEEKLTTKIITAKTNFSHDTTAYTTTTEVTHTEKALMESTTERERKHRIQAQHHLARGEASLLIPSLFPYLVVSILAFT